MSTHVSIDEQIEPRHRRINRSDWENIYIIGDVHGCRKELEQLLTELRPTSDDLVLFVGDLVRKGPDNYGVVELVRTVSNMLSVRGNNEEKLLRDEGGLPTLAEDDLDWMASLPVVISWEGTLVTHAGIDPRMSLSNHTVEDFQNVRSLAPDGGYERPYWFDEYTGPPRVFFGHTVLEEPVIGAHAVGLDTGCVYGGRLTAYDVCRNETTSVQSHRTYQTRKDSRFLSKSAVSQRFTGHLTRG